MFQKGQPRPPNAGRKKGTKNKKRVPLVTEYLASRGINPINEILKLIPELESDQRFQAWKTLLSHTQPNLKAEIIPSAPPAVPEQSTPTSQLLSLVKGKNPVEQKSPKSAEGGPKV